MVAQSVVLVLKPEPQSELDSNSFVYNSILSIGGFFFSMFVTSYVLNNEANPF